MSPNVRLVLVLCFLLGLTLAVVPPRIEGSAPAEAADVRSLSAAELAATFRFRPDTAEADKQVFVAAVAGARPEARRLVALVDGLTFVDISRTPPGALGITSDAGDGYRVQVDLGRVLRVSGRRGVDRVILHELGHVIDRALLSDVAMTPLLQTVPAGFGCEEGQTGACAATEERFAETFAKWATGDIGIDLPMGYKVPPPSVPLETWGLPLAEVGA
jgi:hypothetical protein